MASRGESVSGVSAPGGAVRSTPLRIDVAFDVGGAGGRNDDRANAIAIQHDGTIVLAGYADVSGTSAINHDFAIARLLPNGAPDDSFGSAGRALAGFDRIPAGLDVARAVVQQDNGNLLVAGYAQTMADGTGIDVAMLRLRADGSRDPGFGNLGRLTIDFGQSNPDLQFATGAALSGGYILLSAAASRLPRRTPTCSWLHCRTTRCSQTDSSDAYRSAEY